MTIPSPNYSLAHLIGYLNSTTISFDNFSQLPLPFSDQLPSRDVQSLVRRLGTAIPHFESIEFGLNSCLVLVDDSFSLNNLFLAADATDQSNLMGHLFNLYPLLQTKYTNGYYTSDLFIQLATKLFLKGTTSSHGDLNEDPIPLMIIELTWLALGSFDFDKDQLISLGRGLSVGLEWIQTFHVPKLLNLICVSIPSLCLLEENVADPVASDIPKININSVPTHQPQVIGQYLTTLLPSLSRRFGSNSNVLNSFPPFTNFVTLLYQLCPYDLYNGLQFTLSLPGLDLNLALDILLLLNVPNLGHPLAKNCDMCIFVPFKSNPNLLSTCVKCSDYLPACHAACLGCKAYVHFGCCTQLSMTPSLTNNKLDQFVMGGPDNYFPITLSTVVNCSGCDRPVLGISFQAVQRASDGMLFHINCAIPTLDPSFEPWDSIYQHQSTFQEYLILRDYLQVQIEMLRGLDRSDSKDLVERYEKNLHYLDKNKPADSGDKISILFDESQLQSLLYRAIDEWDSDSDDVYCQPFYQPYGISSLVQFVQSDLNIKDMRMASFVVNQMRLFGSISTHPVLDHPISSDSLVVSLPFSWHFVDPIDPGLGVRMLNNLLRSKSNRANQFGLGILLHLPHPDQLPKGHMDQILYSLLVYLFQIDGLIESNPFKDEFREAGQPSGSSNNLQANELHFDSCFKYAIPFLDHLQRTIGAHPLSQLLFTQLQHLTPTYITTFEHRLSSDLHRITQLQQLNIDNSLLFTILTLWSSQLLKYILTEPGLDKLTVITQFIAAQFKGIDWYEVKADDGLRTQISEGSYIYANAMEQLSLGTVEVLNWFELICMTGIYIPNLASIIQLTLTTVDPTASTLNQLTRTFYYHLSSYPIVTTALVDCYVNLLLPHLTNPFILPTLTSMSEFESFNQLSLAVGLLSLGLLKLFIPHFDRLSGFDSIRLEQISRQKPNTDNDHLMMGFERYLMSCILSYLPLQCELHLLLLKTLPLKAHQKTWDEDHSLISRIWALMDPIHCFSESTCLELILEIGTLSPQRLLNIILPANNPTFDQSWTWLNCAFGFLSLLRPEVTRTHTDAWKFIGPIFHHFAASSLADKLHLQTKFQTLAQSFDLELLTNLLYFWEQYFEGVTLDKKIECCKVMSHINTLFPSWAIVGWSSIFGILSMAQYDGMVESTSIPSDPNHRRSFTNSTIDSSMLTLKVMVIRLSFQLLISGQAIAIQEVYTLKLLMAKVLGFHGAQLDGHIDSFNISFHGYKFDTIPQDLWVVLDGFFSQFKGLVDCQHTISGPSDPLFSTKITARVTPPDDPSSETDPGYVLPELVVGYHFIDLFLELVSQSSILSNPPNPTLHHIVESIMIILYKFDLTAPHHINQIAFTLTQLANRIRSPNSTLSEPIKLSIVNLFQTSLRRAPKLSQLVLLDQILACSYLMHEKGVRSEDAIYSKGAYFLGSAFRLYCSNGLFILMFKNYDYHQSGMQLFDSLKVSLDDPATIIGKNLQRSQPTHLNLPVDEVVDKLFSFIAPNDFKSLSDIINNLCRYMIHCYYQDYSERLQIDLFTNFLPKLSKFLDHCQPTQFDLTLIYLMISKVIRNHPLVLEMLQAEIYSFIEHTVGRFPFKSNALVAVLEAMEYSLTNRSRLVDIARFGNLIIEEFSDCLVRTKPKPLANQVIALCQVILFQPKSLPKIIDDNKSTHTINTHHDIKKESKPEDSDVEIGIEKVMEGLHMQYGFYFPFQKIPSGLVSHLIAYLNDSTHFTKLSPHSLVAGLHAAHLLVTCYIKKEFTPQAARDWLKSTKKPLLSSIWFFTAAITLGNVDATDMITQFQPFVLALISDGLNRPLTADQSSTSAYPFSEDAARPLYPGQTLCFSMVMAKVWISLHALNPHPSAFLSGFWLKLYPEIIHHAHPEPTIKVITIKQQMVTELFAELITLTHNLALPIQPPTLLPEISNFFKVFTQHHSTPSSNFKEIKRAVNLLNKHTLPSTFSDEAVKNWLIREVAGAIAP